MNASAITISVFFFAVARVALPIFILVLIGTVLDKVDHPAKGKGL